MRQRRLSRCVLWWNAIRDRRHNLPDPKATGLGDTERRVQAAANLTIRSLQATCARKAEPLKARLSAALTELRERARPEFDRLAARAGRRTPLVHVGRMAYMFGMIVLSVGEAAFNAVVFSLLRESLIFTLVMALSVAIAIPLVAHMTGVALRQYQPIARKVRWVATGCAVAVITLAGINWIRVGYFRTVDAQAPTDPMLSIAYFALNLCIFAAAVFLTYGSRDPEEGFVEALSRVVRLDAEVAQLRGQLNELNEALLHDVEMVHEAGHQAIAYYRTVNRRGRPEVPAYFDDEDVSNYAVAFAQVEPERFDELPVATQAAGDPAPKIRGVA